MGHCHTGRQSRKKTGRKGVAKREPAAIFKFVLVLKAPMVALERQPEPLHTVLQCIAVIDSECNTNYSSFLRHVMLDALKQKVRHTAGFP